VASPRQQQSRINDVLYLIHREITGDLSISRLAQVSAYSGFHFQRVFADTVGMSVHRYVRKVRLEHAANQLTFDRNSSLQDIAFKCGFQSLSSFSRAFKEHFHFSPGQWRKGGRPGAVPPYMMDPEIAAGFLRVATRDLPSARVVEVPETSVAYVRHQGYGRDIRVAWDRLLAWANSEQRDTSRQFGLHHSNPAWLALGECRYVACLGVDREVGRRGVVNSMVIPGGLHAVFELEGVYGELLPYLTRILEEWLPASGYKMTTTPAWVEYRENHFVSPREQFDLSFFLPISFY